MASSLISTPGDSADADLIHQGKVRSYPWNKQTGSSAKLFVKRCAKYPLRLSRRLFQVSFCPSLQFSWYMLATQSQTAQGLRMLLNMLHTLLFVMRCAKNHLRLSRWLFQLSFCQRAKNIANYWLTEVGPWITLIIYVKWQTIVVENCISGAFC